MEEAVEEDEVEEVEEDDEEAEVEMEDDDSDEGGVETEVAMEEKPLEVGVGSSYAHVG